MAEKLVTVDSGEVRGAGSFVTLRQPKWKLMLKALKAFNAAGGAERQEDATLEMMDVLLPQMIVEWNWTNEETGEVMALPSVDPESWDDLEMVEVFFLINHAAPLIEIDRKN